jgi:uncharacterized protein (DUF2062 family)
METTESEAVRDPRVCVLMHSSGSDSMERAAEFFHDYPAVCALADEDVLDGLRSAGYTHCVTLGPDIERWHETMTTFEGAIAKDSDHLLLGVYGEDNAPGVTRWGVRLSTGFKLSEPDARERVYPLAPLEDLALPAIDGAFSRDSLLALSRGGLQVVEVPLPGVRPDGQSVERPPFSFWRLHRTILATFMPWILPPAYLDLTSRRSYRELPFRARVRKGLHELLLREPGSNVRIGASAGFGFFMGLIPLWGYQILLTIFLSHRLGFSKTVSLVCAQISLPPLIPFIMYGSLVFGRSLLGVDDGETALAVELAPADFWPWFLGSWVLALTVGLAGGFFVWVLASLLRRSSADPVQSAP